ncbi:MAG TPA: hypothetical protein VNQ76_04630 [Planctomicrobium sp.]|nr:hypothetical protein [Planctomicrobium sp.]
MIPKIEHTPEATLKATQIIAAALMAGVVSTIGMVLFLINNEVIGVDVRGNLISLIMAGGSLVSLMLLSVLTIWPVKATTEFPLHTLWQRRMVIRFALLEGAALLNAVGAIVERQWWSFALLLGIFILMILFFPTRTRFEHFIETHTPLS